MWKKVGAIVIIVGGLGVSAYMWSEYGTGEATTDTAAAAEEMPYLCEKCGQSFSITVGEAREIARAGGKLTCPNCGEAEVKSTDDSAAMFWKPPEGYDASKIDWKDGNPPAGTGATRQPTKK